MSQPISESTLKRYREDVQSRLEGMTRDQMCDPSYSDAPLLLELLDEIDRLRAAQHSSPPMSCEEKATVSWQATKDQVLADLRADYAEHFVPLLGRIIRWELEPTDQKTIGACVTYVLGEIGMNEEREP